jgi:hypothetical protein
MSKLYTHENTAHHPSRVTVADAHELHKARGGFNARIAVFITRMVGNMWMAYIFTLLSLVGLLGLLGLLNPFTFLLCTWLSQMFLQLVFLPILSVGQNVLGQHQELVTEETAKNTRALLHQILQVAKHLSAQDDVLLKQTADVDRLYKLVEAIDVRLTSTAKSPVPKRPV